MDAPFAAHRDQVWSRLICIACIVVAALLAAGCGGGTKGKTLTQQYQDALKVNDPGLRSRRLAQLAEKQQAAGDLMGAETSLGAAQEAARSVTDPASRAQALTNLVGYYAKLEQRPARIKELVGQAEAAIEKIVDADTKVPALADLAAARSEHLKETSSAVTQLKAAEDAAGGIMLPVARVRAMARIASAYGRSNQPDESARVLSAALDYARSLSDPREKCDALAEIAAVQFRTKQNEAAAATLAEAEEAAASIDADDSRAYAFLNLAQKAARSGAASEAKRLWSEAEQTARQVHERSSRTTILEEISAARGGR